MSKTIRFLLFTGVLALAGVSCERTRSTPTPAPRVQTPTDLSPTHPLDAYTRAEFEEALRLLREQGHVNADHALNGASAINGLRRWRSTKE